MRFIITFILALAASAAICASASDPGDSRQCRFAWGADTGGAIDLSGHDMSTADIDAYFGLRTPLFTMLGVGAGINMPVNNSRREFPVYAIARTSFTPRPQPVFFEMRAGAVFNTHPDYESSTDLFLSPGIGFRLAYGRAFTSYLTVGYHYNGLRTRTPDSAGSLTADLGDDLSNPIRGIHAAVVRFGITF